MRYDKIVITGGAGFIGSHLAERAAKQAGRVVLVDNLSRTNYNADFLQKRYYNIEIVKADVRDIDSFKDAFKEADLVFHTAAQVTVTNSITDPRTDFDINALGTFNVCEAARLAKTKPAIVFCSTNKVYGDLVIPVVEKEKRYVYKDVVGVSEDYEVSPETANCPYGGTKIIAENILNYYYHTYGIPTVRARMSCVFGTRQFGNEDQGWLSWFAIRTLSKNPITIFGDGKQVRDVLFCTDHARAFFALAENIKKTRGKAFNLGGGPQNTLSLLELLDLIEKITGKRSEISYSDWRRGDQKVYISDITKIKQATGWKPEVSVEEGVRRLVEWTGEHLGEVAR